MGLNQFLQYTGALDKNGSNSAKTWSDQAPSSSDPLSGPAPYNYSYTPGDFLSGRISSAQAAQQQNVADYYEWYRNEYSAQQQRNFEEYMSNTQVQRAMKDLQAAGLNPWLAVQSAGFGGAVPAGAAASSSAGQVAQSSGSPGAALGATAVGIAALVKLVAKFLK